MQQPFYDAVIEGLYRILDFPNVGSLIDERHRFIVIPRFRYVIYYRVYGDLVFVFAIAHPSRRPGYWHRRKYRL